MTRLIDLTGKNFGELHVIASTEQRQNRSVVWECRCSCGELRYVNGDNLRTGKSTSCGYCDFSGRVKHGHNRRIGKTPTYSTWLSIIQRCTNPNNPRWEDYGGRGIKVCKRWLVFENFLEDMGERPVNTTIDRQDNDGNYNKRNCRWATSKEQSDNRRQKATYRGRQLR